VTGIRDTRGFSRRIREDFTRRCLRIWTPRSARITIGTLMQTVLSHVMASQMPPAPGAWAPVVLMILIGLGFAVGNVVLSTLIGPKRQGDVKAGAYESGMVPVGDTRKRFNVRFYIVAMIFLVIDVELVFFYPFATIFAPYVQASSQSGADDHATPMLISMGIFVAILLLAYVYAWGKGVFQWD
jgi:NADH-quinone oxidoreductase subunit A